MINPEQIFWSIFIILVYDVMKRIYSRLFNKGTRMTILVRDNGSEIIWDIKHNISNVKDKYRIDVTSEGVIVSKDINRNTQEKRINTEKSINESSSPELDIQSIIGPIPGSPSSTNRHDRRRARIVAGKQISNGELLVNSTPQSTQYETELNSQSCNQQGPLELAANLIGEISRDPNIMQAAEYVGINRTELDKIGNAVRGDGNIQDTILGKLAGEVENFATMMQRGIPKQ